jgi:outer membrane protein TolC
VKAVIVAILILAAGVCNGQQKVFTEDEFIAVVKKFHPVLKQANLQVRIAQAEVLANRGQFDPVLRTDYNRKEFDGLTYYDQTLTELRIPTWYGPDIVAGQENIGGSRVNPELSKGGVSYIGLSMPLLQNLVINKRRAALRQARVYRDLSEVERRIVINDLLLDGLSSYWDWWEHYNINQLLQTALTNAEERLRLVKIGYQLGDRPAIDTLEALTQIQTFQIRQNENYIALAKAALQVSAFLWTDNDQQYDLPADVIPQPATTTEVFTLDNFLRAAGIHPELTQYQFKLSALEIDRRLKLQQLLPKLDLKYNKTGYTPGKDHYQCLV